MSMSEGTKDDQFGFSDLNEAQHEQRFDDGLIDDDMTLVGLLPPAEEDHSGIVTLSSLEMARRAEEEKILKEKEDAEMAAFIKEQKALHDLYTRLLETTNLFTEPLVVRKKDAESVATVTSPEQTESPNETDVLANSDNLRLWLSVFMNQAKETLLESQISARSNLVKLIDGLALEFDTILTFGWRHNTLDSEIVKTKLGNLTRVLTNLSTAILTHRNEHMKWEEFDAYIPELLGVVSVDFHDLTDLELELASGSTHDEIMAALPEVRAKMDNPAPHKQAKLDKYAEGGLSVYGINEEKAAYLEMQKVLRKLKRTGPKKVE